MKVVELQWHEEQYLGTVCLCVCALLLGKAVKLLLMSNG